MGCSDMWSNTLPLDHGGAPQYIDNGFINDLARIHQTNANCISMGC